MSDKAEGDQRKPRIRIYHHHYAPNDNVSARHFTDLAEGLARRGWDVTACPANRGYPDESQSYPLHEYRNGVHLERVWRPRFRQARNLGRLANAAWVISAWGLQAFSARPRPDVVIIGTDPILSVLAAIPWKFSRPGVRIAHWGFDIYPEAALAEGMLRSNSLLVRALRAALRPAYRCCDLIVDIGACMRELLAAYRSPANVATLVPWALIEPPAPVTPDPAVRRELFGDATLGLLYSGTFGRAHCYEDVLSLARQLRGEPIAFCFAGRGNRAEQLKQAVTPEDTNIRFAGFAAESELEKRLGAADIHLASLQPSWTGTVVPSKFFGSLAAGRPVLFSGAPGAAIARWIKQYGVGWLLQPGAIAETTADLRDLVGSPNRIREIQAHCHRVYQEQFARERVIDAWDFALREMLATNVVGEK